MRHQTKKHTLGKAPDQRKALLRSLATELLTHDEIKTTMARAKALQPYAENLITLAKKGDLNSRRLAGRYIFDMKHFFVYCSNIKWIHSNKGFCNLKINIFYCFTNAFSHVEVFIIIPKF